MVLGQIEPRGHLALIGPLADQIGTPAPAQHKTQRIQQDRLARAGFTGQHVQTRLERKLQPVDDQHVRDIKPAQHVSCLSGGCVPFGLQPPPFDHLAIDLA